MGEFCKFYNLSPECTVFVTREIMLNLVHEGTCVQHRVHVAMVTLASFSIILMLSPQN